MDEHIPEKVDEEIIRNLEKLKSMDPDDKEYKDTLEAITRLHDMRLEYDKVDLDYRAKREKLQLDSGRSDEELRLKEAEEERLQEQARREKKEFIIKMAVDGGVAIVNLLFIAAWFHKGLKFEQNGMLTSTTFKELRQKTFGIFKRK